MDYVAHLPPEESALLQLVYTSVATKPLDAGEMADLCRQSSENNRRDEISGVLVTYADCFLQTLEGPKVAVEDAFLRIMLDSRHHDVMLLSRRTVTKREFGSWDMAHYDRLTPRHEIIERVSRLTQAAPEPMRKAYNDLFTGDTGDSREMH